MAVSTCEANVTRSPREQSDMRDPGFRCAQPAYELLPDDSF
jgi:hypothetical protein